MEEFRIEVLEGYEIDKEKSTFEKIVFKKKEQVVNCWNDLNKIDGFYINDLSHIRKYSDCIKNERKDFSWFFTPSDTNKGTFLNEKYAKSALALAQISQLLPYYDTNVDWSASTYKYCIVREHNGIVINKWQDTYHVLAFNKREEAERFLKYNEQLVEDYFML